MSVKISSSAWVKMLRAGRLSPQGVGRIAANMLPGGFRTIKNLGQGHHNIVDLVVGNVGSSPGYLARKLPKYELEESLTTFGRPLVQASREIEAAAPGSVAKYVHSGPRGIFQEYVAEPTLGSVLDLYFRIRPELRGPFPSVPMRSVPDWVEDLNVNNLSASGKILDFRSAIHSGAANPV